MTLHEGHMAGDVSVHRNTLKCVRAYICMRASYALIHTCLLRTCNYSASQTGLRPLIDEFRAWAMHKQNGARNPMQDSRSKHIQCKQHQPLDDCPVFIIQAWCSMAGAANAAWPSAGEAEATSSRNCGSKAILQRHPCCNIKTKTSRSTMISSIDEDKDNHEVLQRGKVAAPMAKGRWSIDDENNHNDTKSVDMTK